MRIAQRSAFGALLMDHETVQHQVAKARSRLEQARLLVLHAAAEIDAKGARDARVAISLAKLSE